MNDSILSGCGVLILGVVFAVVLSAVLAWPVQLLWNDAVTAVFGLKAITFMQAWQLSVLASLLFKDNNSSSSKKD